MDNRKKGNGNKETGIITEELQERGRGKGSFAKATISKVYECVATLLAWWDNKDLFYFTPYRLQCVKIKIFNST